MFLTAYIVLDEQKKLAPALVSKEHLADFILSVKNWPIKIPSKNLTKGNFLIPEKFAMLHGKLATVEWYAGETCFGVFVYFSFLHILYKQIWLQLSSILKFCR